MFTPAGFAVSEAAMWLGAEERLIEKLLLNYTVLVTSSGPWGMLGGRTM